MIAIHERAFINTHFLVDLDVADVVNTSDQYSILGRLGRLLTDKVININTVF